MSAKATILVVEDDADISEVLAMMLRDQGYRVVLAANGKEGIEELRRAERLPDVILLDLMMPVLDGWGFRKAQSADSMLANIPVVLVSAHVDVRAVAGEMGVAAWLRKPIDFGALLNVVERPTEAALEI